MWPSGVFVAITGRMVGAIHWPWKPGLWGYSIEETRGTDGAYSDQDGKENHIFDRNSEIS